LSTPLEAAFYSFEINAANIVSADDDTGLDGDNDGMPGPNRAESYHVAIPGDTNLDGAVDVLSDALALIGNLNFTGATSWAQGDFNADGTINVLGDALILIANLGRNVQP